MASIDDDIREQGRHQHQRHNSNVTNIQNHVEYEIAEDDNGGRDNVDDAGDDFNAISKRHYQSTAAMCLCNFTHSWLLVSVFPYSGFMVISLVNNTDTESAGPYAGLLAAAFMIGRAVTSFLWGRMADIYGRKVVLFVSLTASCIFSVLFGLSTSFISAFSWRFLLGASNGIAGISKAIVTETASEYEILETRGMSLIMGQWAWGFLISPALAGFVADPIRQYKTIFDELKDTAIYTLLKKYPFILPNLISVILCLLGILAVFVWVPETLPESKQRHPKYILSDACMWLRTKVHIASGRCWLADRSSDLSNNHTFDAEPLIRSGTVASEIDSERDTYHQNVRQARMSHTESVSLLSTSSPFPDETVNPDNSRRFPPATPPGPLHEATMASLWKKVDTRNHLMLYWVFSFVAIAIDEAFPLFCMSKIGGLGLSENEIGKLLSSTGLIFAVSQYHIYAWIVDKYGLNTSIRLGAALSAPLAAFIPLSLWMNDIGSSSSSELTWPAFIYLSLLLAACRIFGLVFFSSITIVTNRTVGSSQRGTMNGLSMLGGSCAKGLGPVFAGYLVGFGYSSSVFQPQTGSWFVFLTIGLLAAITARWTTYILRKMTDTSR